MDIKIVSLEKLDSYRGYSDVIVGLSWWASVTIENGSIGFSHGYCSLEIDEDIDFIPYSELTEEDYVSWFINDLAKQDFTLYQIEQRAIRMAEENDPRLQRKLIVL